MKEPILQRHLPQMPWMSPVTARLPGIQPLDPATWLLVDDAHAGQMAERDRLIAERAGDIHALLPKARAAADELLGLVVETCRHLPGYDVIDGLGPAGAVRRADGRVVGIDRDQPLLTIGQLVQEDFCIHLPDGHGEHALMGAVLCFPASWTLAEKIGRPLVRIHRPVAVYDERLAARVQRLFDAIHVDKPLWRANAMLYASPNLHHPMTEDGPRQRSGKRDYLRSERQCLRRLPETGAVVFSIHTSIVHVDDVPPEAMAAFLAQHP